jgi:hypothetical protein
MAARYILYDGTTGETLPSTQLQPGEVLGVKFSGLNDPFDTVVMEITFDDTSLSPIHMTAAIYNWFSGDAQGWFTVPMPTIICKGTIKLYVQGPTGTTGPTQINIGIGEVAEPPVPPKDDNLLTELETILKWTAIGAGVIAIVWVASKAAPGIASGISQTRKH